MEQKIVVYNLELTGGLGYFSSLKNEMDKQYSKTQHKRGPFAGQVDEENSGWYVHDTVYDDSDHTGPPSCLVVYRKD